MGDIFSRGRRRKRRKKRKRRRRRRRRQRQRHLAAATAARLRPGNSCDKINNRKKIHFNKKKKQKKKTKKKKKTEEEEKEKEEEEEEEEEERELSAASELSQRRRNNAAVAAGIGVFSFISLRPHFFAPREKREKLSFDFSISQFPFLSFSFCPRVSDKKEKFPKLQLSKYQLFIIAPYIIHSGMDSASDCGGGGKGGGEEGGGRREGVEGNNNKGILATSSRFKWANIGRIDLIPVNRRCWNVIESEFMSELSR